jgi:hypothetical protein
MGAEKFGQKDALAERWGERRGMWQKDGKGKIGPNWQKNDWQKDGKGGEGAEKMRGEGKVVGR